MKRSSRGVGACAVFVAAASSAYAPPARAQATANGFALDRFNPSERGSEWFALDSLDLRGDRRPAIGVVGEFADSPLVIYNADGSIRATPVHVPVDPAPRRVARALRPAAPRLRSPHRRLADRATRRTLSGVTYDGVDSAGVGDLRLGADVRLFGEYGDPFRLAVGAQVFVPTGNQNEYLGDGSVAQSCRACWSRATSACSATPRTSASTTAACPTTFAGTGLGSEFVFGASAGVRVARPEAARRAGALRRQRSSRTAAPSQTANTPVELLIGAHYLIASSVRVGLGVGARPDARLRRARGARPGLDRVGADSPHRPPPPDRRSRRRSSTPRTRAPTCRASRPTTRRPTAARPTRTERRHPRRRRRVPRRAGRQDRRPEDQRLPARPRRRRHPRRRGRVPRRAGRQDRRPEDQRLPARQRRATASSTPRTRAPTCRASRPTTRRPTAARPTRIATRTASRTTEDACPDAPGPTNRRSEEERLPAGGGRRQADHDPRAGEVRDRQREDPAGERRDPQRGADRSSSEHPEIKHLRVEGHTDNVGAAAMNKSAQRRPRGVGRDVARQARHRQVAALERRASAWRSRIDDNETRGGPRRTTVASSSTSRTRRITRTTRTTRAARIMTWESGTSPMTTSHSGHSTVLGIRAGRIGASAVLVIAGIAACATDEAPQGEPTSTVSSALFTNGGFETPANAPANTPPPAPWTVTTHLNSTGITVQTPQTHRGAQLGQRRRRQNLHPSRGGRPRTQTDPDLGATASLRWPRYGNQCAIVNQHGNGRNVNVLSQTMTVGAATSIRRTARFTSASRSRRCSRTRPTRPRSSRTTSSWSRTSRRARCSIPTST